MTGTCLDVKQKAILKCACITTMFKTITDKKSRENWPNTPVTASGMWTYCMTKFVKSESITLTFSKCL
jgi:hypothetical protein